VSEPFYYTSNTRLLNSEHNWTFEKLHFASDRQFARWVKDICGEVLKIYEEDGIPPKAGKTDEELFQDFRNLVALDVKTQCGALDENDGLRNTLLNTVRISAADHFFPNIFLAKDNLGSKRLSVMDKFREPESMVALLRRNLKNDGYFDYSPLVNGDLSLDKYLKQRASAYGCWFYHAPKKGKNTYKKVRAKIADVKALVKKGALDAKVLADIQSLPDTETVYVRAFKQDVRVFPKAFRAFQTGLVSAPTNFPAAVAKTIYTYGTEAIKSKKPIVIYDPSLGFGGRLLGALSLVDRDITFLGCDPNTLNVRKDDSIRYAVLEQVFKSVIKERTERNFRSQYFLCGSEDVHTVPEFQAYKGKVDLVFTSPPYFDAEIYSDDASQSSIKFASYERWREHFLARTLQTAAEWLARDRYLIINIARMGNGKQFYPLEEETKQICRALGLRYVETKKMLLSHSPGSGRNANGTPTSWNFAKVNGAYKKYEPVLIFRKEKAVPKNIKIGFSRLYSPPEAK